MIKELLKEANKPLNMLELISEIENRYKVKKTKQQIRNALNAYDCKDIVRVSEGMYDLLSRVINGNYFRYSLTDIDVERGILSCDRELQFIFNSVFRVDNLPIALRSANGDISSKITFYGGEATPRRAIEGFGIWFKQWNLCPCDDVIIKVVDYDAAIYEIVPQKKESRNEELILRKNKETADILHEIASRTDIKGGWIDMLTKRVTCEYSYKDNCPPDTISRIAASDNRFYEVKGVLGEIYLTSSRSSRTNKAAIALPKAYTNIFQFRISLDEIRPTIWRRIQVPSSYSFWDLHVAIQDAMGWLDCHLHEFQIKDHISGNKAYIGIPDEDSDLMTGRKTLEGWKEPIAEWFSFEHNTAKYVYDFGDDWKHNIELEKIMPCEENVKYPRCIGGECACPPEDVGSVSGYFELIEIMKIPSHPGHKEMVEWIGNDNFDPAQFDLKEVKFDDPDERFKVAFHKR
ncbi:MAG: plasmid pRiA4b ORF-3 family protein [Elusimicrobiota bacterium]